MCIRDRVNTGHCVTDRLGVADITDVELDLLGVLRVLGLKLMEMCIRDRLQRSTYHDFPL